MFFFANLVATANDITTQINKINAHKELSPVLAFELLYSRLCASLIITEDFPVKELVSFSKT